MTVKEIKIGWKQLKTILEGIRNAVNHNQPLQGYGITLHEGDKGTIISLHREGDGNQDQTQTQTGQIPGLFQLTIYGITLKTVTIVDPTTCAQSTLDVYCRNTPDAPGYDPSVDGIKFQVFIDLPVPGMNPVTGVIT